MIIFKTAIPDIPKDTPNAMVKFFRAIKNRLDKPQAVELPVYTAQDLNATTARLHAGKLVRCSNGDTGDECLAYCDGFNWKVVQLGSTVSIS